MIDSRYYCYLLIVLILCKRATPPLNLYISWYPTRPFLTYGYQKRQSQGAANAARHLV